MANYTKLVQSLAKEWNYGVTSTVKSQRKIVEEILAGFNGGIDTKPSIVGDTLELSIDSCKKYLAEFCDVFTEGKYTVIKHKTGGIVDVSKIGDLNRDGTIIRYGTSKQAEEEAKKILMRQFDLPREQQREVALITRNNDLFLNSIGEEHCATLPSVIEDLSIPRKELKLFHNHPTNITTGKSYPLSIDDIFALARNEVKSITAINHLGEFSTATITKPFASGGYTVAPWIKRELIKRLEQDFGKNVVPEKNPELYIQEVHKAYKELLSQCNIEYSTNYSYLTNL